MLISAHYHIYEENGDNLKFLTMAGTIEGAVKEIKRLALRHPHVKYQVFRLIAWAKYKPTPAEPDTVVLVGENFAKDEREDGWTRDDTHKA